MGFKFNWGALGLWLGVASATALQAVVMHLWVALRLDWQHEVARSQATVETLLDSHAPLLANGGEQEEDAQEQPQQEGQQQQHGAAVAVAVTGPQDHDPAACLQGGRSLNGAAGSGEAT